MELKTKKCNHCGKEKFLFEFGFLPSKNKHNSKCKECSKNNSKPWYVKDSNIPKKHPWKKKWIKKPETDLFNDDFDIWWKYG